MKTKHAKTLKAIFAKPTLASVVFADIEALVVALGGEIVEGNGSRMAFILNGKRMDAHRPHPGKEAKRYQVETMRDWLLTMEIQL
ncbi:MAG: type II toxin-antitoxin system HicA family toxin [Gallionellaceae bacterium]|nr:MAG: type II toxin-antitoxin system HicA family toxin [Gallionellaceae bacterium]